MNNMQRATAYVYKEMKIVLFEIGCKFFEEL